MSETRLKDPSSISRYIHNWSDWLDDETLSASTWSVAPSETGGLTVDSTANTTTTATVVLSGGVLRSVYVVTNHITASGGEQCDRDLVIRIGQR